VSGAEERAAAEQAKLDEDLAVMAVERRGTDLLAAQQGALAEWSAAKGQLARAQLAGNAERIAAAKEHERGAFAEFEQASRTACEELLAVAWGRDAPGRVPEPEAG
jgi:hypothetical protein